MTNYFDSTEFLLLRSQLHVEIGDTGTLSAASLDALNVAADSAPELNGDKKQILGVIFRTVAAHAQAQKDSGVAAATIEAGVRDILQKFSTAIAPINVDVLFDSIALGLTNENIEELSLISDRILDNEADVFLVASRPEVLAKMLTIYLDVENVDTEKVRFTSDLLKQAVDKRKTSPVIRALKGTY